MDSALLGRGALVVALLLALYAVVSGVAAGLGRDRRITQSARNAVYAVFAAVLVADAVFLSAILRHDFSFATVASNTSRSLPGIYLVTSFWGSQSGSLLLWVSILTGASALVVRTNRRSNGELMPWVVAVLGTIGSFFLSLLVFPASPFVTQAAPTDGTGLNPSLQNPYMAAHPPSLYLGYVGLAIPFAFAMAALLSGRTDARWIVSTRRWTLAAWGFLGIGMLLGAHWAYLEVGWGGFWAWDPVENAALIPWLVATAFLHSVLVQEKKGMLKVWNVSLIAATFSLALLGTFFTRSGVVQSIHAFVESDIGPWFVSFIAFVLIGSAVLIIWRLPLLKSETHMESLVSREATFLFNNLLFVGLAFAVLWGVLFPMISQAVRGVKMSVSSPYYEFFATAFGLPLLLLMGVGPLIAWRRASLGSLKRTFLWPLASAMAFGVLLILLGYDGSPAGLAAYALCLFVTITIVLEFVRGTIARRAIAGASWPVSFLTLIGRNRRRYGGYIAHLSIVLFVIGAVGATAYQKSVETRLAPGSSVNLGGYTLTFQRLAHDQGPNYSEAGAILAVHRGGDNLGTLTPARRSYTREQMTSNEVAIRTDWWRAQDLYVILNGIGSDGSANVKVIVNPLVNLIWVSSIVFLLGTLVAAWPDAREARRIARRYAEEPLAGEV